MSEKKRKTIKVDRDTYELVRKLHILDANVEITKPRKEVKEEDDMDSI